MGTSGGRKETENALPRIQICRHGHKRLEEDGTKSYEKTNVKTQGSVSLADERVSQIPRVGAKSFELPVLAV